MKAEGKKYDEVLKMLRKSNPVLPNVEAFAEMVMRKLMEEKSKVSLLDLTIEYLFGWVYIGWVRRSMVTVVLVIAFFFVYQQFFLLRRINDLSGQRIQNGTLMMTSMTDELTNKMLLYKFTGKKFPDEKLPVSEKEIDEMIRSLNKLQVKYRDLIILIENDPQLKKYVEARMNEKQKK